MNAQQVLIIAADPLIRAGLAALLVESQTIEVAGLGESGSHIDDLVDLFQPTAVVWDVGWDPGDANPIDWQDAPVPLIFLLPERIPADPWLKAGASGVLTREVNADQIGAALEAAGLGLVTLSAGFTPAAQSLPPALPPLADPLTGRETEILQLIADGLTNKAIAAKLGISPHTVKFHITGILSKLDVQSRTEAVSVANRLGLLVV